jgi:hypothetical protein
MSMTSDHDNNYKRIARRAEVALGQDAKAQRAALVAISKMALAAAGSSLPARRKWAAWQEHLYNLVYAAAVKVTGDQPRANAIAEAALKAASEKFLAGG